MDRRSWWMSEFAGLDIESCWFVTRCSGWKCFISLIIFVVFTTLVVVHLTGQDSYTHPPQRSLTDRHPITASASIAKDAGVHVREDTPVQVPLVMSSHGAGGPRRRCSSSDHPTNIVFIKVHKAGSTTVSNLLARYALNHDLNIALPEQEPVRGLFHCFGPFREYRVLPLAENQPYHVLFNHMIYNRTALNNVMPKDTFYVAIMREPLKRLLSGMYFFHILHYPVKNNTDNPAFKRVISKSNKPRLEKDVRVYNTLVQDTGLPQEEQKKADSVKKHLERLDRELDLMMVMEHFLESLVLFKRRACLRLRDIVFMQINVRVNHNIHNITQEDLDHLKSWQMADHMAYDHFYAKFWNQIRQEGDSFPKEVDHFRRVMEQVQKYCSGNSSKWDVLVIGRSPWNGEFSLNERDCQWMMIDEQALQKILLTRARERRKKAGYQEIRRTIPRWNPIC